MLGAFLTREDRVMTSRMHLGLRVSALLVLAALALLPRARGAHHDPTVAGRAVSARSVETISAKLENRALENRDVRRAPGTSQASLAVVADADESRLTN